MLTYYFRILRLNSHYSGLKRFNVRRVFDDHRLCNVIIHQKLYLVDAGDDVRAGVLVRIHCESQIGPVLLHLVHALLQSILLRSGFRDTIKLCDIRVQIHSQDLPQRQIGVELDGNACDRRDLFPMSRFHPGIAQDHHRWHPTLELLDSLAHRSCQLAHIRFLERFLQLVNRPKSDFIIKKPKIYTAYYIYINNNIRIT